VLLFSDSSLCLFEEIELNEDSIEDCQIKREVVMSNLRMVCDYNKCKSEESVECFSNLPNGWIEIEGFYYCSKHPSMSKENSDSEKESDSEINKDGKVT
jgi:hypothetical protein